MLCFTGGLITEYLLQNLSLNACQSFTALQIGLSVILFFRPDDHWQSDTGQMLDRLNDNSVQSMYQLVDIESIYRSLALRPLASSGVRFEVERSLFLLTVYDYPLGSRLMTETWIVCLRQIKTRSYVRPPIKQ